MKKICTLCILLICCSCILGCSSGLKLPDDLPDLTPCSITIKLDDSPVTSALVMLKSDTDKKWGASGFTNSSGTVNIKTAGQYPGVPQGEYKVLVSKNDVEPTPENAPLNFVPKMTRHIDESFEKEETTSLKLTVAKKAVNETFEVTGPKKK